MDRSFAADPGACARVQLAKEPGFSLGALEVDPSTRQLSRGAARATLEPRVMQVLVVLAAAAGHAVSKDELTERCWDGRIVGEDAINRVISQLRRVSGSIGRDCFTVETIRGVGYRLAVRDGPGGRSDAGPDPSIAKSYSRRSLIVVASAATGLAAVGLWSRRPPPPASPHPSALEFYRRGLETRGRASVELNEQGVAHFREATRIDPQFSAAWGALAWAYRGLLEFGPRPDAARIDVLARAAASRALQLDPDNADAKAAVLLLKPFYRHWEEIEAGCSRLLDKHPANSLLQYNLGAVLQHVGRWRDSIPYLRAVSSRERFWPFPHIQLAQSLATSGHIQEAEDVLDEAMRRYPKRVDYWLTKVRYLTYTGRFDEALAFAEDLTSRPADSASTAVHSELALMRALADGSTAVKAETVRRLELAVHSTPALLAGTAVIAAVLGATDTSFSMLEGYYFGTGPWAKGRSDRPRTEILFALSTASLRRQSRFPDLLRRTGLLSYWQESGKRPDYAPAT